MTACTVVRNWDTGLGPKQESEELIVPRKPGNAGGGKGLWFEVRSDKARGWRLA